MQSAFYFYSYVIYFLYLFPALMSSGRNASLVSTLEWGFPSFFEVLCG